MGEDRDDSDESESGSVYYCYSVFTCVAARREPSTGGKDAGRSPAIAAHAL